MKPLSLSVSLGIARCLHPPPSDKSTVRSSQCLRPWQPSPRSWHGACRAEYWFRPDAPRNGQEAAEAADFELDQYMHLAALNRGILMTPFHNMALICPATTEADIDRHTEVFNDFITAIV